MRMFAWLGIVIAAVALTGCNTMRASGGDPSPTAFKCTYDVDCVVYVHVTDTNPCVVSVDKPEIEMKGSSTWHAGVKHLIRWQMDEASHDAKFRFDTTKGVALKSPDPDDQFSGQGPQDNGKQFHWRDKNSNYYTYDYEVNVFKKTNPAIKCKLDPKIYNN